MKRKPAESYNYVPGSEGTNVAELPDQPQAKPRVTLQTSAGGTTIVGTQPQPAAVQQAEPQEEPSND